jgi:hypothetical protein
MCISPALSSQVQCVLDKGFQSWCASNRLRTLSQDVTKVSFSLSPATHSRAPCRGGAKRPTGAVCAPTVTGQRSARCVSRRAANAPCRHGPVEAVRPRPMPQTQWVQMLHAIPRTRECVHIHVPAPMGPSTAGCQQPHHTPF